jgi:hypothetical protein
MHIVGREQEIKILNRVYENLTPAFLALYGRRRVGKTYLIREFFKDKGIYFELTGIKDALKLQQLKNFSMIFSETFVENKGMPAAKDWGDAFMILRHQIEKIPETQKVIIFFDEIPWLASRKSGFLEALDLFWNRYLSTRKNLILIICGSAAEWMIRKIVLNKGGLHNRLTHPPIHLKPFTLRETESFLSTMGINLDRKQIIDIYMAVGGVAYYLNLIPQGKSSAEILAYLFFSTQAPLALEFQNLFYSLFEHPHKHIEVIKVLAQTCQGLTQTELFQKIEHLSKGGGSVLVLEELEHCGFITKILDFGKKKKDMRYRLTDGFCLFYLKWVAGQHGFSTQAWLRKKNSAAYHSWSGYAFENICLIHYRQILKSLELSVVADTKSSWRYRGEQNSTESGAQIDLIIDRADKCINLCEIKFYDDEWHISKALVQNLKHKKLLFREKTKSKKTLFTTLISTYPAFRDPNYLSVIDSQVTMDDLFAC